MVPSSIYYTDQSFFSLPVYAEQGGVRQRDASVGRLSRYQRQSKGMWPSPTTMTSPCLSNYDDYVGISRADTWPPQSCVHSSNHCLTSFSSRHKSQALAILVLVNLGQHDMVLSLLQTLRQHQLAARYLEACLECGALIRDPKTGTTSRKLLTPVSL